MLLLLAMHKGYVALPGSNVAVAGALPIRRQSFHGFLRLQGDPHVHHAVGVVDGLTVDCRLFIADHLRLLLLTQGRPHT